MANIEAFTPNQLAYLYRKHNINIIDNLAVIKDGVIKDTELVWWKAADYPEKVHAATHWQNIKEYPHLYSIERPKFELKYLE